MEKRSKDLDRQLIKAVQTVKAHKNMFNTVTKEIQSKTILFCLLGWQR